MKMSELEHRCVKISAGHGEHCKIHARYQLYRERGWLCSVWMRAASGAHMRFEKISSVKRVRRRTMLEAEKSEHKKRKKELQIPTQA